jgi:hypothetical protein
MSVMEKDTFRDDLVAVIPHLTALDRVRLSGRLRCGRPGAGNPRQGMGGQEQV